MPMKVCYPCFSFLSIALFTDGWIFDAWHKMVEYYRTTIGSLSANFTPPSKPKEGKLKWQHVNFRAPDANHSAAYAPETPSARFSPENCRWT